MIEREQKSPEITLGQYNGFGRDLVQLNKPITDGFIKSGDIRSNIVIVEKDPTESNPPEPDKRERFLNKLPSKKWQNGNITEIRRDHKNETWYLGIDDDKLFTTTKNGSTKITFDEQYIAAFQTAIANGLRSVLKREKLLNSGKYNLAFTSSYLTFIGFDLLLLPTVQVVTIAGSDNLLELAKITSVISASYIVSNSMRNGFNSLTVLFGNLRRKIGLPEDSTYGLFSNYNDPFIKHTTAEHLLPPVPIDKLIKGLIYLKKHQHELVQSKV